MQSTRGGSAVRRHVGRGIAKLHRVPVLPIKKRPTGRATDPPTIQGSVWLSGLAGSPNGASGCCHGWSESAKGRRAEPVEAGDPSPLILLPRQGRRMDDARNLFSDSLARRLFDEKPRAVRHTGDSGKGWVALTSNITCRLAMVTRCATALEQWLSLTPVMGRLRERNTATQTHIPIR